jgi:drug/metabolite transporter (DMT)-like permease
VPHQFEESLDMSDTPHKSGAGLVVAVFLVVVMFWGSTFVAVKYTLVHWSALQVMAGRYVFGAVLLMPLAWQAMKTQREIYQAETFAIIHLAVVGSLFPVGLMTWAQQTMPSSFAGVIASLAPMMALIAGIIFFQQASRPLHWIGVVLGTCGVIVLRWGAISDAGLNQLAFSGNELIAALMATVCWGLAAQNYRRHLAQLNPIHVTALSFQVMAFIMLCFVAVYADDARMRSHTSWLPSLYLIGLAALSAIAVTGYNWLIARWGAVRASACTYAVPLIALMWGYLDAEPLGWSVLLAACFIAAAMWAVRQPVKAKDA